MYLIRVELNNRNQVSSVFFLLLIHFMRLISYNNEFCY